MTNLSFEWDQWNVQKNEAKHGISSLEAESAFFDPKLRIFVDVKHTTTKEKRWIAYGRSGYHNILMLAFTVRNKKIRIISARRASRKERKIYDQG